MLNAMTDEEYMQLALQEARAADVIGEIPIGAVLVVEGEVVAKAHNMRETWNDATAHAEVIVIREACKKLGRWRLEGAVLYVTVEPCPMCSGASSTVVSTRLFTAVLMLKPEGQSRSLISSVIPILIIRHRSSAASVKPNVHR